jgi:hypothetical protein
MLVSTKNTIARINRKLAAEGLVLRTLRGTRCENDLGRHYIVNYQNGIVDTHVDPETLGRELGVLHEREAVVSDEAAVEILAVDTAVSRARRAASWSEYLEILDRELAQMVAA